MLVERLRERAAAEPDAAAFIVAGGGSLTYRTWNRRSEALSQGLLERGVRPDDRVVLSFEARNWCDFAVAYAGVHQAGA
ncbi:MAG: AMP-binding protein, partial [Actinomycetota bacterium]|nr:AMP-binding protein [Actinomycetota bacterium]